jgi:hypothetical protein
MSVRSTVLNSRIEAMLLVLIGSLFILAEGAFVAYAAATVSFQGVALPVGVDAEIAGLFLIGLLLIALDFAYLLDPERGGVHGTLIIILAIVVLLLGGGFLVGSVLATIGGVFAVVLAPEQTTIEVSSDAEEKPTPRPGGLFGIPTAPGTQGVAWGTAHLAVVRYCLRCGAENTANSSICIQCRAALPAVRSA